MCGTDTGGTRSDIDGVAGHLGSTTTVLQKDGIAGVGVDLVANVAVDDGIDLVTDNQTVGTLIGEKVATDNATVSHIVLCRTHQAEAHSTTREGIVADNQRVGTTRIEQSRSSHIGFRHRSSLYLTERAAIELASYTVGTHTYQIGGRITGGIGKEVDVFEAHVVSSLQVDQRVDQSRVGHCRHKGHCATKRFKLHVIVGRDTGDDREGLRHIIARSQLDGQRAVDTALAKGIEQFLERCIVGSGTSDGTNAVHRTVARNEASPQRVVERLVVSVAYSGSRHRVFYPSIHFVITGGILLSGADSHIGFSATGQGACPVKVLMGTIVDREVYTDSINRLNTIVL